MKILWLNNLILPEIAERMGIKPSQKEGWVLGTFNVCKNCREIELGLCFPVDRAHAGFKDEIDGVKFYGFYEDTVRPENYDKAYESELRKIVEDFKPDVVHIFGTEFPHTLAMCRVMKEQPEKVLVGMQGIVSEISEAYFDGVPQRVIDRITFRDFLKKDSLKMQQKKFSKRAVNEQEALKIAGNITGRTDFDFGFTGKYAPQAKYHFINETLRNPFYEDAWSLVDCETHSIFLSQGNYPIKGAHYMLEAMAGLQKKYEDIKLYIAGDNITKHESLKEKLKLSSYGKYLLELIKKYGLEEKVVFTGALSPEAMKERLLKSNVFICPSTIENSPNSLGEAMLLGVPCIAADVGGISSIFRNDSDGIMYKAGDVQALCEAVEKMFEDASFATQCGTNASLHARATHNPNTNMDRLLEIYKEICR